MGNAYRTIAKLTFWVVCRHNRGACKRRLDERATHPDVGDAGFLEVLRHGPKSGLLI
jgi:hypothetical protein